MSYAVGDKIGFAEERCRYIIEAANERYLVCNRTLFGRPFYTVVDLQDKIRGTEDRLFCMGSGSRKLCEEMLERLTTGFSAISRRNRIPLVFKEPK